MDYGLSCPLHRKTEMQLNLSLKKIGWKETKVIGQEGKVKSVTRARCPTGSINGNVTRAMRRINRLKETTELRAKRKWSVQIV